MSPTTSTPHITSLTTLLWAIAACEPPRTSGKYSGPGVLDDPSDSGDASEDERGDDGSGPPTLTDDLTGMVFHRIAPSSFEMGCTAGQSECYDDESPVMPVALTYAHYMGETEVTQAQFEAALGYNPSSFDGCENCPVEQISWHEAAALSNALSSAAGLAPCYPCTGSGLEVECDAPADLLSCDGYRLPTEAEWEGAARCGADTLYAGSDEADEVAWTAYSSGSETHPVGALAANACGLYDMSGNVWEWVSDWYGSDYYRFIVRTDPPGPPSGSVRAFRGGAWGSAAQDARVSSRTGGPPAVRYYFLGVRLLRTAPRAGTHTPHLPATRQPEARVGEHPPGAER